SRYARGIPYSPRRAARLGAVPTGVWPCKDGFVELMAHNPAHWHGFLRVIGSPDDLAADETLADRAVRLNQEAWLAERVAHHLALFPRAELLDGSRAGRVRCARWSLPADFVDDSQPVSRHFWVEATRSGGGPLRAPAVPFHAAPDLGTAVDGPPAEPGEPM